MKIKQQFLQRLGVYGYDPVEPVILAALVSGDPLLLIGRHGTGKTFLLNSLSEALGLEHRHYNASLVSFDDLVGFPFPEKDGSGIRFLETPATVWQAESVLVDELNRCKPEHQNRFFSLVHERRIQGIKLDKLRYRWAAMNPAGEENGYIGTEPLDAALADRFAFIIHVVDWDDLSPDEQLAVADPRGDGAISRDGGALEEFLRERVQRFEDLVKELPPHVPAYASTVASALSQAGVRISPRRTRQLSRNLLAASVVSDLPQERLFRLVLRMSIPQSATGEPVPRRTIEAAHRIAWDSVALEGKEKWLHEFVLTKCLSKKAELLFTNCPDPETGTVAVSQFIAAEPIDRIAAFVLAVTPHLLEMENGPVGSDGVSDLSRILEEIIRIHVEISWREPGSWGGPKVPKPLPAYEEALKTLGNKLTRHYKRSLQLLNFLVSKQESVPENWQSLHREFKGCFNAVVRLRKKWRNQNGAAA